MDPLTNIFLILFILIAVVVIILICVYYIIKKSTNSKDIQGNIPDASLNERSPFNESIKLSGLNPDKVISYGRTCFSYDKSNNIIFVQTVQVPEGITINSGDVASAEVYRDGKAAEPEAAGSEFDFFESRHRETTCSDLHITVTLVDGSEINLPLIDAPVQYGYVYTRARDVANEIAAVLKEIISKRNQ